MHWKEIPVEKKESGSERKHGGPPRNSGVAIKATNDAARKRGLQKNREKTGGTATVVWAVGGSMAVTNNKTKLG